MLDKIDKNFFGSKYSKILVYRRKNIKRNRFILGSNYNFSKFHKIIDKHTQNKFSYSYSPHSSSHFSSGSYFQLIVKFPRFGYMKDYQVKSFRNLLKKPYKNLFGINFHPYLGITKKPAEVRMGKGKGSKIAYRVFPFKAGQLFGSAYRRSNAIVSDFRFSNKFKFYASKLPMKFIVFTGGF